MKWQLFQYDVETLLSDHKLIVMTWFLLKEEKSSFLYQSVIKVYNPNLPCKYLPMIKAHCSPDKDNQFNIVCNVEPSNMITLTFAWKITGWLFLLVLQKVLYELTCHGYCSAWIKDLLTNIFLFAGFSRISILWSQLHKSQ